MPLVSLTILLFVVTNSLMLSLLMYALLTSTFSCHSAFPFHVWNNLQCKLQMFFHLCSLPCACRICCIYCFYMGIIIMKPCLWYHFICYASFILRVAHYRATANIFTTHCACKFYYEIWLTTLSVKRHRYFIYSTFSALCFKYFCGQNFSHEW